MGYTGEKKREYQLAWITARRDTWFKGRQCVMCGCTSNLEADHIDPSTKRWNPREIWSRKESDRTSELAKCQVLCRECHIVKGRIEKSVPCSERTCERAGCGCTFCKELKRNRMATWRSS